MAAYDMVPYTSFAALHPLLLLWVRIFVEDIIFKKKLVG